MRILISCQGGLVMRSIAATTVVAASYGASAHIIYGPPKQAITLQDVGPRGEGSPSALSYKKVTSWDWPSGQCLQTTQPYSGPMSPLDEGVICELIKTFISQLNTK